MRIAYFSPLNPLPSGISDYSEDLLPYLAAWAEIELFIDQGYRPINADLEKHFQIYRYDRYPRLRRRRTYDVTLYHVGNSPAHDYILSTLERHPGVIVLHDYVLHHLMLWRAFRHGDGMAYHDAMIPYGEAAWQLALRMMRGQILEDAFHYPLCEPVIEAATAVIAHSHYVIERVRQVRPEVPTAVVPMGVPLPALPERDEARRRLDLPAHALILASFGHMNPYKRLEPALRAFRRFRETHPEALFLLVGSLSEHFDLAGLLRRLELQQAVRVTGYVDLGAFLGYLAACDICLNLRYPSAGETSASLLRILGAGIPTLISRTAAFVEIPSDVAIQVDADGCEEEEIVAFLAFLADHPEARRALGQTARRYVAEQHTLEGAAAGTARFLAQLCGEELPAEPPRSPLFAPRTGRPASLPQTPPSPVAVEGQAPPPIPLIAQSLAELGLQESDRASLAAVAETLVSLPELLADKPGEDA